MKLRSFELSLAATFAALTAAGAYICIPLPFTPVPITMQTFFTYLAALLLGGRLAALSQTIYMLLGVLGLPVFAAGKAGFAVLLGPTGGYILGFILGAFTAGKIYERNGNFMKGLLALLTATAIIYGLGVIQLWLAMNTLYGAGLRLLDAAIIGTIPFIFGDLAKILAALSLIRSKHIASLRSRICSFRGAGGNLGTKDIPSSFQEDPRFLGLPFLVHPRSL